MRTTRLRQGGSELSLAVTDGLLFLTVEEDGAVARIELPVPVMITMVRAAEDGARRGGDAGDAWGSSAGDQWRSSAGDDVGWRRPGDGWGSAGDDVAWRRPGGRRIGDVAGVRRAAGIPRADGSVGSGSVATIIPFPRPAPPPARSGLPWSAAHDAAVRTAWLAAAPDADRTALLAAIARAVERGVGGVTARLARLGCDPAAPGRALPGGPHRPAS